MFFFVLLNAVRANPDPEPGSVSLKRWLVWRLSPKKFDFGWRLLLKPEGALIEKHSKFYFYISSIEFSLTKLKSYICYIFEK